MAKSRRHYYVLLIILFIFVALYYLGGFLGKQCSSIAVDGCPRACWNIVRTSMTSELCPSNEPCMVEPYKMQHNAIVDLLSCACEKARKDDYKNQDLNIKIVDLFNYSIGYRASVDDICSGATFVKLRY